jgi:hypothetical protein
LAESVTGVPIAAEDSDRAVEIVGLLGVMVIGSLVHVLVIALLLASPE